MDLVPSEVTRLRYALTADVLERSTYRRESITFPQLEAWVGARIDKLPEVYLGHSSVTIPPERRKLILYTEMPATVGEMARAYLRRIYEGVGGSSGGRKAPGWAWNPPLFCDPIVKRPLAYLDISAAYWQLVGPPWRPDDIALARGGVIEVELDWLEADTVAADRELRLAVVGCIFAGTIAGRYCYGKPSPRFAPNRWSSPSMRRVAMATLHAIAGEIRARWGLHAFLTDAAIVNAYRAPEIGDWLAVTWGLASKVKAMGEGSVWSVTQYSVGDRSSQDILNGNADPGVMLRRPFSNLVQVDAETLRTQRLSRIRGWHGFDT